MAQKGIRNASSRPAGASFDWAMGNADRNQTTRPEAEIGRLMAGIGDAVRRGQAKSCQVPGCARKYSSKGFCNSHYAQKARGVEPGGLLDRAWTESDERVLRDVYSSAVLIGDLRLEELAKKLGRTRASVGLKASRMGLGKKSRPRRNVRAGKQLTIFRDPVLQAARVGATTKRRLALGGHPRGMLGKNHTAETREVIAGASRRMWADPSAKLNSPATRQLKSDISMTLAAAGRIGFRGVNPYSRAKHGRRDDLDDRYFRSSWEANYARFLNWLKSKGEIQFWDYECKTFWFLEIKRGVRSYTPDFLVVQKNGKREWHEVKGWMDPKSKTKIDRFRRYYPEEFLRIIDAAWFRNAARTFAGLIPNWEKKSVRVRIGPGAP